MPNARIDRMNEELADPVDNELQIYVDGTILATAQTTQLLPHQRNVNIDLDSTYTHTIKLPSVGQCVGKIFSFYAFDAGGGCAITSYGDAGSIDDAEDWTDIALDADNDNCALISTGRKWIVLALDEN